VLLLLSAVLALLARILESCFEAYCDVYVGSMTPGLFVSTDLVWVRHRETHLYAQCDMLKDICSKVTGMDDFCAEELMECGWHASPF
jgi:hypothetical protein